MVICFTNASDFSNYDEENQKGPGMPAVKIEANVKGVHLENLTFSGFSSGIEASEGAEFSARNLHFENVTQPFDIRGARADVSGSRITSDPKLRHGGPNKSHVGWSPTSGPALPAKCPKCEAVFPSTNYKVRTSRFWSRDNEEVCPLCKYEHAIVADGIFDITEKAIRILAGPDVTVEMLKTLREISLAVVEEVIGPEQAVAEYEKTNPQFAEAARAALSIGRTALSFLAAVATIASPLLVVYYAEQSYHTLDATFLEGLVSDVLERTMNDLSGIAFLPK